MFEDFAENNAALTPENSLNVFLYGSLLPGEAHHDVLQELIDKGHAERGGTAAATGLWCADLGLFPAAYHCSSPGVVPTLKGELYRVTGDALNGLDRFEGIPYLFYRTRVPVTLGRESASAYCYMGRKCAAGTRQMMIVDDRLISDWTKRDVSLRVGAVWDITAQGNPMLMVA